MGSQSKLPNLSTMPTPANFAEMWDAAKSLPHVDETLFAPEEASAGQYLFIVDKIIASMLCLTLEERPPAKKIETHAAVNLMGIKLQDLVSRLFRRADCL
jgi:hypothetical protein